MILLLIDVAGDSNSPSQGTRRVILSGSFNPLHDGHIKLLDAACRFDRFFLEGFTCTVINTWGKFMLVSYTSDVGLALIPEPLGSLIIRVLCWLQSETRGRPSML
jgi:hypothetical protein